MPKVLGLLAAFDAILSFALGRLDQTLAGQEFLEFILERVLHAGPKADVRGFDRSGFANDECLWNATIAMAQPWGCG